MECAIPVDPVLFFVAYSVSAGNLARWTRLVNRTGQWSITEGFGPVSPAIRVPVINDNFDGHDTTPNAGLALGIVGCGR
jgi:hypothetical protein